MNHVLLYTKKPTPMESFEIKYFAIKKTITQFYILHIHPTIFCPAFVVK